MNAAAAAFFFFLHTDDDIESREGNHQVLLSVCNSLFFFVCVI